MKNINFFQEEPSIVVIQKEAIIKVKRVSAFAGMALNINIYANNTYLGSASIGETWSFSIIPGTVTLKFIHKGYFKYCEFQTDLEADETRNFEVSLTSFGVKVDDNKSGIIHWPNQNTILNREGCKLV